MSPSLKYSVYVGQPSTGLKFDTLHKSCGFIPGGIVNSRAGSACAGAWSLEDCDGAVVAIAQESVTCIVREMNVACDVALRVDASGVRALESACARARSIEGRDRAVAIAHDLQLPIRYVGVGEGIDDLVPFSAEEYVDGLFEEQWDHAP